MRPSSAKKQTAPPGCENTGLPSHCLDLVIPPLVHHSCTPHQCLVLLRLIDPPCRIRFYNGFMFRSKGDPLLLPIGRARPDTTILLHPSPIYSPPCYLPLCGLRASIYLSHAVPCAPIPTHSTHQPTNPRLIQQSLYRGAEPPAASVCQNNRERVLSYTLLH